MSSTDFLSGFIGMNSTRYCPMFFWTHIPNISEAFVLRWNNAAPLCVEAGLLKKYTKTILAVLSLYFFAVYFVKPLLISYEGEIIPIVILYFRIWIFFIMSGINLDIFEQFLILPFFLIWLFIHWWIKWSLKSAGIT